MALVSQHHCYGLGCAVPTTLPFEILSHRLVMHIVPLHSFVGALKHPDSPFFGCIVKIPKSCFFARNHQNISKSNMKIDVPMFPMSFHTALHFFFTGVKATNMGTSSLLPAGFNPYYLRGSTTKQINLKYL